MKIGDKVKVKNKPEEFSDMIGEIVATINVIPDIETMETVKQHRVQFRIGNSLFFCFYEEKALELVVEPKVYHLDLSVEDMNALSELGKMKDNLELLERLLKRAKGETND